jgi:hypothetical protein
MTAAGVALLKAEELQLGLDLVEEALTHGCGVVEFLCVKVRVMSDD